MSEKIKHNKLALKSIRKDLRNNATPAERELWKYISSSKLAGRKFRRQHSINNYIVDSTTHTSIYSYTTANPHKLLMGSVIKFGLSTPACCRVVIRVIIVPQSASLQNTQHGEWTSRL